MNKIIPLFLYNKNGLSKLSYTPNSDEPTDVFYVVDSDIQPLPYGMELFCVEQEDFITNISEIYDPFNRDRKCLRFLGWNDPAPYTTPVFIYKKNGGILLSTEIVSGLKEIVFSPIHLLTKNKSRIIPYKSKKDFQGEFLFSDYNGRCLPNPDGTSIEKCLSNSLLKSVMKTQPLFLKGIPKRFPLHLVVIIFLLIIPIFIFVLI